MWEREGRAETDSGCASRGTAWPFSEMGSPESGASLREQGSREEGRGFGFQHVQFQMTLKSLEKMPSR